VTSPAATLAGVILGTAAYMSPEQAKGRAADKRSDVWAFGAVLYEMLTGRRAFEREDISDTLASVLKSEPAWSALPADVPPHVRTLVQRCLAKDRRLRVADGLCATVPGRESGALAGVHGWWQAAAVVAGRSGALLPRTGWCAYGKADEVELAYRTAWDREHHSP